LIEKKQTIRNNENRSEIRNGSPFVLSVVGSRQQPPTMNHYAAGRRRQSTPVMQTTTVAAAVATVVISTHAEAE
jgi:hypothetical protein